MVNGMFEFLVKVCLVGAVATLSYYSIGTLNDYRNTEMTKYGLHQCTKFIGEDRLVVWKNNCFGG